MPYFRPLSRFLAPLLCAALGWALAAAPAAAQEGVAMRGEVTAPKPAKPSPGLDATARKLAEAGAVPSAVDSEYKITPSDLLEIEVFGVSELKRTVRVNTSGQIAMPLIGTLSVAGLTPSDAEALIALQYSGKNFLQDPQVSIFVKEFTTQRITLDGALTKPGVYPLTGQITLLRALAMAGGGGQLADMENVMLFRVTPDGQSMSQKFDVLKIRKGEAVDPMLQNDDVVVVNRSESRVTLRDSLFRDVIDTLNPFASSYRNAVAPN
ncbi:MAG: polysaccharide biosynthesis/export family protein [Giesbergeria sp.]